MAASHSHGAVAGGAVGSRLLGWTSLFRYEVRCWRDGQIPDVAEAVESPRLLSDDPALAQRILDLVPLVPTPTWGRDELRTGDMWNSNSLISWLLVSAGFAVAQVMLPRRQSTGMGRGYRGCGAALTERSGGAAEILDLAVRLAVDPLQPLGIGRTRRRRPAAE